MTKTAEKKASATDETAAEAPASRAALQDRIDLNDPALTDEEAVAKNLGLAAAAPEA